MPWTTDQLDVLGRAAELQISSYRADGTLRRWTPIWVVRVGDDLYIRSAYGADGAWYRNATRHSAARVRADGIETDVALEPAVDPATNTEIDAAYRAKYRGQESALRPMLAPPAMGTSLRLRV